ncbi:MAG TPA: hypothetical protein VGK74_00115 [Symbiobacteriaceae bacterium]|jgi:hypothetical protein
MPELGREFVDALSIPSAEFDRNPYFTYSGSGRYLPLIKRLIEVHDYAGIGRLYEAIGAADLMLLHIAIDNRISRMEACFALTLAAHWYRKGGETELAILPAKRVLVEAERLRESGQLLVGPVTYYHWYLIEIMGDAAAVFDPERALGYYREALDGFATVEENDELGEGNEVFPGNFLYQIALHFLVEGHRLNWMLAKGRIPAKISQWLKA